MSGSKVDSQPEYTPDSPPQDRRRRRSTRKGDPECPVQLSMKKQGKLKTGMAAVRQKTSTTR